MMFRKIGWLLLLAAISTLPRAAAGEGFTTTTTHIEADCSSFLKIDRPEPQAPTRRAIDAAAADKMHEESFYLLLAVSHRYFDGGQRLRAAHFALVEFPSNFSFDKHNYHNSYLVALYDSVGLRQYASDEDFTGTPAFSRYAFLDVPIACTGFKYKFDAPDRTYWEALDIPLCTTLSHETGKDGETWKILNVPLIRWFHYQRRGDKEDTQVLDVPLATFYESHREGADNDHWTLLDVPLATLASGEQTKTHSRLKLLDLPLVYLWSSEAGQGRASARFLKAPIVGPLFASWSDENGNHAGLLPKFFSSSYEDE